MQAEDTRLQLMRGGHSIENLVALSDAELGAGRRKEAAELLLQACQKEPDFRYLRDRFWRQFSEEEVVRWNLSIPPTPIFSDIGSIMAYPLIGNRWVSLLLLTIFMQLCYFVAAFAMWWWFLPIGFAWAVLANHLARHMMWAANGKPGDPPVVDFSAFDLWCMVFACLGAFFPAIVLLYFRTELGVLFNALLLPSLLLGAMMFPMAFLVARMHNRPVLAFHYPFILASIFRITAEYFFAIVFIALVEIFYGYVFQLFEGVEHYVFLPAGFVSVYVLTMWAYLMGRLYYANETKLGWFGGLGR